MTTNKMIIIVTVLLAVACVGWDLYRKWASKKISNQLLGALYQGEFEKFDQLMASDRAKRQIPLFNRKFLELNKALMQDDRRRINELLKEFEDGRMSQEQKAAVHSKVFYYFLSCEDKRNATKYYKLLKENKAFRDQTNLERVYDTYILKGCRYLEEVEKEAGEDPYLLSMTADMYLNKGDEESFRKYADLAKKYAEQKAEETR